MTGFIFGGDTGMTYENLQNRRKIVQSLMKPQRQPQYALEGLAQGIGSVAGALFNRKLDEKEGEMREDFDKEFAGLFGGSLSGGNAAPANITASSGDMEQYRNAIASIESAGSGDYQAIGPTHEKLGRALGRYQIMEANIAPWSREALGREVSADEFLASPEIQDAIFDHKFGGYVNEFGPEGAAQAWFAGPGGVGKMSRQDVLGTTVRDYTKKFANALGGVPRGSSGGSGPNVQRIAQIMAMANNPMANPAQQQIAQIMLEREMQAGDPMRAMELEKAQLELDALRNPEPKPREIIKGADGYQYYADTRERVLPNVTAAPQVPLVDFSGANIGSEGQSNLPIVDKPSKDYQRRYDHDKGTWVDEPIPGTATAQEISDAEDASARKEEQKRLKLGTTLTSIGLNIEEIENGGLPVTGAWGDARRTWIGRALTGSDATDFGNRTGQINDSAAFAEIQNMRDNSPTGGAVGQLTDKEREAIGNSITALNQAGSAEEYLRAAKAYRDLALNLAYGEGNWRLNDDDTVTPLAARTSKPSEKSGITADVVRGMTATQRATLISEIGLKNIPDDVLDVLIEMEGQP